MKFSFEVNNLEDALIAKAMLATYLSMASTTDNTVEPKSVSTTKPATMTKSKSAPAPIATTTTTLKHTKNSKGDIIGGLVDMKLTDVLENLKNNPDYEIVKSDMIYLGKTMRATLGKEFPNHEKDRNELAKKHGASNGQIAKIPLNKRYDFMVDWFEAEQQNLKDTLPF